MVAGMTAARAEDLRLPGLPPEPFADLLSRAIEYSNARAGEAWKPTSLAKAIADLGVAGISASTVKSHLSGTSPEPKRILLWGYSQVLQLPLLYWLDPEITQRVDEQMGRAARERGGSD